MLTRLSDTPRFASTRPFCPPPFTLGTCTSRYSSLCASCFHISSRQIVLVLLATGDAYLVDLRKEFQGRVELVEELDEEEEFSNRSVAFAELFLCCS